MPGCQALPSEAFTRPCNPAEPGPLSTATGGTICRRARLAAPPFTSHRGPAGPSIYPVGSGVRPKLRFPRRSSVPGWQALPSEAFTRPCNPAEPGPLHTATDGTICRRARLAAPPFTSHRGPAGPSIGTRWGWGSDPSSGSLDGAACPAGRHCRRKRLPARATRQSRARFLLPRAGRFAVGSVYPPVQPGRAGPASYCHGRDDLSACPVGSTAVHQPPRPRWPLDRYPVGMGVRPKLRFPRRSSVPGWQALPSEAFTRPCNPAEPGPLHTATGGTICRRARLAAPPFTSHRGPAGPSIGTRWGWGSDPSSGSLDGAACPAARHCRRKRLPARATRQSRARFLLPRAGRFVGVPGWQHRRSLAAEAPRAPRSTRWVRGSDPSSGSLDGAACLAGRHCRRKRLPARATRQSRARFLLPRAGRRGVGCRLQDAH